MILLDCFPPFYSLEFCCDTIDLKSTNALYMINMLHIAHVNVECKTLKTNFFIFFIVNKEEDNKKMYGAKKKLIAK